MKEGAKAISEALKFNQILLNLNLGKQFEINILFIERNQIGNEGAISVSEALKINQTMHNLNLGKYL